MSKMLLVSKFCNPNVITQILHISAKTKSDI